MPLTQIPTSQVKDGTINRDDLDVTTVGKAVIRKLASGSGLSLASTGVDTGTGDVTVSAPNSANWDTAFANTLKWDGGSSGLNPATGRTSLGATALGGNIFTIANNALGVTGFMQISNANVPTLKNAANTLADLGGEPALGNPSVSGYILSSTTAGVRSWIAPPSGGGTLTFTGDVTGSGTSTINLQIAANVITAAEIAPNAIGASEINNTQDMAFAALQTITISDAGTTNVVGNLRYSHATSGVPGVGFGVSLSSQLESTAGSMRDASQIHTRWTDATDATRTAYIDFQLVNNGVLGSVGKATPTGWDIKGTTSNDSAASGYVGQIIASAISFASRITSGAVNVAKNLTSISLAAGDWDVRGIVGFYISVVTNGAVQLTAAISNTSATIPDDGEQSHSTMSNPTTATLAMTQSCQLPERRISLAATTTIYLVGQCSVAGQFFGYIEARRPR